MPSWQQRRSSGSTPLLPIELQRCESAQINPQQWQQFVIRSKAALLIPCSLVNADSVTFIRGCFLQMYDLYTRERIDTKADIWVSLLLQRHSPVQCNTEMLDWLGCKACVLKSCKHVNPNCLSANMGSSDCLCCASSAQRHRWYAADSACKHRVHAGSWMPAVLPGLWQAGLCWRGQTASPEWGLHPAPPTPATPIHEGPPSPHAHSAACCPPGH